MDTIRVLKRSAFSLALVTMGLAARPVMAHESEPQPPNSQFMTLDEVKSVIHEQCEGGEACNSSAEMCEHVDEQMGCVHGVLEALQQNGDIDCGIKDKVMQDLGHMRVFCDGYLAGKALAQHECGPPPPQEGDVESAREQLAESCSCDDADNHGDYVSCVAHALHDMKDEGLVTQEVAQLLQREAAHSKCGKKDGDSSPENANRKKGKGKKGKRGKR